MRWSINIARIAGTEVRIHITFLLFLVWIGFTYYAAGGPAAAVQGVMFTLGLFGCVLLHEFGHALAARRFGIPTPDITLLPIGGVARLQRMPDQPMQELIVALAGPAVNVVIAAVLIFVLGHQAQVEDVEQLGQPGSGILGKLASVNISLVIFNLIPAFPMDGGRVLRAILAMNLPYARATQIAASVGQTLAFVFGFIGLFYNPMLIFIAFFIFIGAQQEAAMAQMKELSRNVSVSEAMVTQFMSLPAHATLEDAVQEVLRTSQHEFPVVDDAGRVLGMLTRDDMIAALRRHGPATPVVKVMQRDVPLVQPDDPFDKAFQLMQERAVPALPVVDRLGRLRGLITPENVGEMMLVNSLPLNGGQPAWRGVAI